MSHLGKFLGLSCLLFSASAWAQVEAVSPDISVFASSCEKMINGESRASARIRAVDKASFKAVENIPELSTYKDSLATHEFNLKVYRLVDNYLEDVKINSSNQSEDNVCVEVSAYLPPSAISEVFAEAQTDNSSLALEEENFVPESSITIPPKPQITINKAIAYDNQPSPPREEPSPRPVQSKATNSTKVFIDKTEFYNNTSTGGFFAYLEQAVMSKPGIEVIAKLENPDYILKTRVLKARVDNINSQTSRLQIVVAVELVDTSSSKTITDHQNRFVLFSSAEDAQQVASELTRKLFSLGVDKLLPKIKLKQDDKSAQAIITPN